MYNDQFTRNLHTKFEGLAVAPNTAGDVIKANFSNVKLDPLPSGLSLVLLHVHANY